MGHSEEVFRYDALAESRDERRIIVRELGKKSEFTDKRLLCPQLELTDDSPVNCVALNDEEVISGNSNGMIKIWNRMSGKRKESLTSHTGSIQCISFQNNLIVVGGVDKTVRVWDRVSESELFSLQGHETTVEQVMIKK
ncbi:MAG: hypothetical protein JSR80_07720, partial [Verrucomicrobia bacterium]|nr:hypothetical protein [Verrucomicrobiota bacterium]